MAEETESVIHHNAEYVRLRSIRAEPIDDNIFLIDQPRLTIDMLDPLAAYIWELLSKPISIDRVSKHIAEIFPEDDPDMIRFDIEKLFREFLGSGFISKFQER